MNTLKGMVDVDAGVVGFDGGIGLAPFHVSAYDIVAQAQGQHLFVVKNILDDHYRAITMFIGQFVGIFIFLGFSDF